MTVKFPPDSPLSEYAAWFESSILSANKSKQTRDVYLGAVQQLDAFLAAQELPRDLTKIKRLHLERFMRDQLTRLKPASAAARYAGLRAFFTWALAEALIEESPVASMKPPKVPIPEVKSLRHEEVERLFKACAGATFRAARDLALLRFMLDTGVRRSEAAHLKVEDFDLKERIATVRHGKGDKDRVVRFSPLTQQALFRYEHLRKSQVHASSPFFWIGRAGALSPDAVAEVVARRSKKAGLSAADGTPVHAHMLRHTWASNLKRAGVSDESLMELGGWSSHDTMLRYGRDQRRERALDAADRYFGIAS